MRKTKILGTGSYLPKKILTNDEIARRIKTTDEWIVTRTGIHERRIVGERETCSDMACQASLKALEAAHVSADEIDMIIVASMTPDQRLPSVSFLLQDKLKAKNAAVYDIAVACSGYVFALSIADQYIKTGAMKKVLVVGVEVMSEVIDWEDRSTCVLFGDGAGAAVLGIGQTEERSIVSTHLFSNGSLHYLLNIPGGGSAAKWTPESLKRKDHFVKMKGKEVFRVAAASMASACKTALDQSGFTLSDVSVFIPHQANIRIIHAVARILNCPLDKIFVNLDKYGNTSAASIAVALDEAVRESKIKKGDLVLLATFGAGFAWGSALIRW